MRAFESASVTASRYVSVHVDKRTGAKVNVAGGVLIEVPLITTAAEWCDYYGVDVADGIATLFKAVDEDWSTSHARAAGIFYRPGEQPEAPDWDGGRQECGGGLHFSPRAFMALAFHPEAKRFVACPVALKDIKVHKDASMPQKVKARRVVGPIYECDQDGNPVAVAAAKPARKSRAKAPVSA